MSDTCQAEREYPQDGSRRKKKADSLYLILLQAVLKTSKVFFCNVFPVAEFFILQF